MISNVRPDHPHYTRELTPNGFILRSKDGEDVGFNEIARSLINSADVGFSVFPRPAPGGGYDSVEVVIHD